MRTFVIGDIHGAYKALKQCLDAVEFDYWNDTLIQLGDVCDGWSDVYECVDELLKIRKLIPIRGNHDEWFRLFIKTGNHPVSFMQGGDATRFSYLNNCKSLGKDIIEDIPERHKDFFLNKQKLFHIDNEDKLFVHGGINRNFSLSDKIHNSDTVLMWDRDFWMSALSYGRTPEGDGVTSKNKFKIHDEFNEVFIGHTSTINWGTDKPMNAANVWNLDTGCGYKGKLTIMNVETKEYWQSENVNVLYSNEKGRN